MAAPSKAVVNKLASLPLIFQQILALFPSRIDFAFAYGSGVFSQTSKKAVENNMIDLVLTVDNPLEFHTLNLEQNRSHYSFLKYGGPHLISKVQQDMGAGVYYNTLVPFHSRLIKYGVVSKSTLISDLLDWETLYLSGRLHKPVLVLKEADDAPLKSALKMNLNNAVHTALLLLPENFTEEEFYRKITGLSYVGDFRMWVGEDRNKICNIVRGSYEQFRLLYSDIFSSLQHVHWHRDSGSIEQDWSPATRLHHLNLLPKHLQLFLYKSWNRDGRQRDLEDVLKIIAQDIDCESVVQEGVERIVWRSSWSQSLKGISTGGILKSVRYSAAKVKKMIKSWSPPKRIDNSHM